MLLIKSIKKWKFVLSAFLVLAAFSSLSPTLGYGLPTRLIAFLACLAIAAYPFAPLYLYQRKPAEDLWSRWSSVDGIEADKRKQRAALGKLSAKQIDPALKFATFVGLKDGGTYQTTLSSCTCPDFTKRKAPCKHMYYLASKCGVESLEQAQEENSVSVNCPTCGKIHAVEIGKSVKCEFCDTLVRA